LRRKLKRDSISLSLHNNRLGCLDGGAFCLGLGDRSSCRELVSLFLGSVSCAASSSLNLKGVKHLVEVCGLLERDNEEEWLLGRDFGDAGVGPLDQQVGNLDDFRVAALANTFQVHDLVLLRQDVLQQVDVGCGGSATDQDLACVAKRVFGGVASFPWFSIGCLLSLGLLSGSPLSAAFGTVSRLGLRLDDWIFSLDRDNLVSVRTQNLLV